MTTQHKRTLILIGGYGRSGSTIVDMELSRNFSASSLGEVRYARRHILAGLRNCSCGVGFNDCVYWSYYCSENSELTALSVVESSNVFTALKLILSKKSKYKIKQLFDSLFSRSSPSQILVDSSKTSWGAFLRPLVIASALKDDTNIHFIGVYRRPTDVLQSLRRGSNEEMDSQDGKTIFSQDKRIESPWLKLLFGWGHANIAMLVNTVVLRLLGMEAKVFAYDDIVEDFELITRSCGLSGTPSDVQPNHLIGGNRLASNGPVRIQKQAVSMGKPLSSLTRLSIFVFLGPILATLQMIREKPKVKEIG